MSLLPPFPVEGGCVCGAVRYKLTAPPLSVYACHCRDCQRFASGPYAIGIIVDLENFAVSGPTVFTERIAESGRTVRQFACSRCACRIWHENAPGPAIVRAGTLDEPAWARPAVHTWTRSKLPWIELGGAPAYQAGAPSRQTLYDAWGADVANGDR
jgi:hypothetical protein